MSIAIRSAASELDDSEEHKKCVCPLIRTGRSGRLHLICWLYRIERHDLENALNTVILDIF